METIAVSVVMPVYNAAPFLHQAIDSILNQTLTNFEFIIINDCSTDLSEEIILSYSDKRIKYEKQTSNQGVVAAMNKGLSLASATFVAVMHADDIAFKNRLEKQFEHLKQSPNIAVLAGKSVVIDCEGKETNEVWDLDERAKTADTIRRAMIMKNCISHPTVMMRKKVIEKYGYSSSPNHVGFAVEDYPLWLHALSDGYQIEKLDEKVLYYRTHKTSATNSFLRKANGYLINYETKKFYLKQRKTMKRFTSFDRKVKMSTITDWLLGKLKRLKLNRIK